MTYLSHWDIGGEYLTMTSPIIMTLAILYRLILRCRIRFLPGCQDLQIGLKPDKYVLR